MSNMISIVISIFGMVVFCILAIASIVNGALDIGCLYTVAGLFFSHLLLHAVGYYPKKDD